LHYASQKGKDSYKYAEAFLKNYYNCSYQLFITEETHREIEVQREIMSATSPSAERALANIHQQCILSPIGYKSDIQREHLLRMAAAYIRKVYDPDIPGISKRMTYPGVSDARIILSAYDNGMPLVTYNLNEFFIYACMDQELYDSSTDELVSVDPVCLGKIQEDPIIRSVYKGLKL
jgi:hypothetical protein